MKKNKTGIKAADLPAHGSAEALAAVLARARQMLVKLNNGDVAADSDLKKIEELIHENRLLRKELSELNRLINEKL